MLYNAIKIISNHMYQLCKHLKTSMSSRRRKWKPCTSLVTPNQFENNYFKNLIDKKGLLHQIKFFSVQDQQMALLLNMVTALDLSHLTLLLLLSPMFLKLGKRNSNFSTDTGIIFHKGNV